MRGGEIRVVRLGRQGQGACEWMDRRKDGGMGRVDGRM